MRHMLRSPKHWLLSTFFLLPAVGITQFSQEWVSRYNSPLNGSDIARSIAVDASGNVYVTGSTGPYTSPTSDYATIKYNAAGVVQWEARFNGAGNAYDAAQALAIDAVGNVYVTGASTSLSGVDYTTIKYNAAGVLQWQATFNGQGNGWDLANDIALDPNGNVYVTGESTGGLVLNSLDYATVKYNSAGVLQWVATYNGPIDNNDSPSSLNVDKNGNVYVTGSSLGNGTNHDYATVKYNTNGVQQWVARYNGPGNGIDMANRLATDTEGNVYVTGRSDGGASYNDYADYATIKYDKDGTEKWVKIYNGSESNGDVATDIDVDAKGNVYVTGKSNLELFFDPGDPSVAEFATVKYDAGGNQLWVAKYNGPAPGFEGANALALDNFGNVYVTGESRGLVGTGDLNFLDYATIKYNSNGIQQWVARYNGPAERRDEPNAIAVDQLGNVYVTGFSTGIGTGVDYATIKYSQMPTACGNNGDKVLICHKGKETVCISQSAVAGHLDHGDQLGACSISSPAIANARVSQPSGGGQLPASFQVTVIPNPAAVTAKIFYDLPVDGRVSIRIFDMLGRQVTSLVDAVKQAGFHNTELDVTALPQGIYYYRITVKSAKKVWTETGKINVLMR